MDILKVITALRPASKSVAGIRSPYVAANRAATVSMTRSRAAPE